jgi:HEAT repeat protein
LLSIGARLHWITKILKILSKILFIALSRGRFYFTKNPKKRVKGENNGNWISIASLEMMQSPVVEYLEYKLKDKNTRIRCLAADTLGDIGDARGIDSLAAALNDRELDVRIAAAKSLWRMGRAGNTKALTALISS